MRTDLLNDSITRKEQNHDLIQVTSLQRPHSELLYNTATSLCKKLPEMS